MGLSGWRVFWLLLLLLLPFQSVRSQTCSWSQIQARIEVVGAVNSAGMALLCESAAAALAFLKPFGLSVRQPIRIEIVERPLMDRQHPLYGSYDATEDLIRVMSQQAIMAQPDRPLIYEQPFDPVHYRGIIAHEVAHAVVHQHAPDLNRTAQEYLAHTTQLALQPEARRQQIITSANVDSWQLDDVISDIYMAMALTQFAVKSYLHLTEHPQPRKLVKMLLASKWRYVVVEM